VEADARQHPTAGQLLLKEEVYAIVGAALEVANELGCGFLEAVYQEALEIELAARGLPFEPQKLITIDYKGRTLSRTYTADLICYGTIVVELKALKGITHLEDAQLLNYLRATGLPLGLLINFGAPRLEWRRFANTRRAAGAG
jgi:GxxExxY protein